MGNSQPGLIGLQNWISSVFQILHSSFVTVINVQSVNLRLAIKLRLGLITVLKDNRSCNEYELH